MRFAREVWYLIREYHVPMLFGIAFAACLTGCGTAPARIPQSGAPVSLVQSCRSEYSGPLATNADLLAWGLAANKALAECDDDKTALREWNKLISR